MAGETQINVQDVPISGEELTYFNADVSNGNSFSNDGNARLALEEGNGSGTGIITISTAATVEGLAVADLVITVVNGELRHTGRIPIFPYNDASNLVTMAYTGANAADVNVAVYR